MKPLYLLLLFLTSATWTYSQRYYVAIVRGQVYYQDKLLHKRDKIKLKGQLRFSTADDYVKLSGPGGLYTLRPNATPNAKNEFLLAIKEELFPKIRRHTTSATTMVVFNPSSYFNLQGHHYSLFDKTPIQGKVPLLKPGEELGFLHETDRGLVYRTASIKDSLLLIKRANFQLPKIKGRTPQLKKTVIVKVMEKDRWLRLIQEKDSIAALGEAVTYFNSRGVTIAPPAPTLDMETGEAIYQAVPSFAAEILDEIERPRFIKKRKMVKDLRFHLRKSTAPDMETFLDDYKYKDYILTTYGNLYGQTLYNILQHDLKLTSQYSGSNF